MGDTIVKLYQRQNFVISEDVLRAIKKNNLTLDETLLIIYFCGMNNHAMLDMEEIKEKFGMDEISIMKAFASITEKNLITIKMEKNRDNKVEEIMAYFAFFTIVSIHIKGFSYLNASIFISTAFNAVRKFASKTMIADFSVYIIH